LANLEAEVSKASKEKERLELALGAPENYSDKNKFNKVESDYKTANKTLQTLNKEYETLFEKVMELEMQMS
jgi:ATP-binding cassette subfamily F protein 3